MVQFPLAVEDIFSGITCIHEKSDNPWKEDTFTFHANIIRKTKKTFLFSHGESGPPPPQTLPALLLKKAANM